LSKSLRIAFIAPFGLKTKGTVSARILPLANALAELGHQVRIIVPPWDDPNPISSYRNSSEIINNIELVYTALTPPMVANIPLRLVQSALAFRPDIIHVFKPKAYSGLAASLLHLRRVKFVLDTDDWEGTGGWNEINPYSPLQKRLFAWQEQNLPKQAQAVTVASRTLQNQVWGFGVKPEKVLYLPNGLAEAKYNDWHSPQVLEMAEGWRKKLNLEAKTVVLAYTRFAEFKAERLIKIFAAILKNLPEALAAKTYLLVVGGGFFKEEETLVQLALPYGIAAKIITTGTVQWEAIPALLALGDVAVYPFDDNLINRSRSSIKFLELLAAKKAVVTEAVGELREYLREGEGGYLIKPGDTAAFAKATAQLLQLEPAARNRMGAVGAQRLWCEYNWKNLAPLLEDFYTGLILSPIK
jgi:glycosyltransferase involved in cell wall biosynthesis